MTTRRMFATAMDVMREGMPSRARMNKFGWSEDHFRHRKLLWDWATCVLKRQRCGAARRRDGKPCRALNVPGSRRCRWHGGLSTGPRTEKGRAKALANLKQYSGGKRGSAPREQVSEP